MQGDTPVRNIVHPPAAGRGTQLALASLLVVAFITGGSAGASGLGDTACRLLAIAVAIWALWSPGAAHGRPRGTVALGIVMLVVAVVAIQQLPLPHGLWHALPVRDALATDVRAAGAAEPAHYWSLVRLDSERALWSLLPALAAFASALALPRPRLRSMLLVVVGLGTASALLAILQAGADQHSLVNPFPQWPLAFNGLFSNPNHQGTAAAMSVVIVVSLLVADWRSPSRSAVRGPRGAHLAWAIVVAVLVSILILTGSRAAFLLAICGVAAVPWLVPGDRPGRTDRPRGVRVVLLLGLGLGALAVLAAAWLLVHPGDGVRWNLAATTAAMGLDHAPLGAGTGAFAPWFDQVAPSFLVQWEYFNHAHNEYVQWWFEGGVAAVAAVAGVAWMLIRLRPRRSTPIIAMEERGVAAAAWLGCVILLLHSIVDYPLRTPALMTIAGLLAGIVVALATPLGRVPRR